MAQYKSFPPPDEIFIGAVVTRDIEPFGIAVGVPARVVETRKSGAFGKAQASQPVP